MRGYAVDVPPNPRTSGAIEAAILDAGGKAFVGLKAPGAARSAQSRYRAALTDNEAQQAMAALTATGVEVLGFYDAVNVAVVRVPANRVHDVVTGSFVDFAEPVGSVVTLDRGPVPPSARARPAQSHAPRAPHAVASGDVIPWGVALVHAPDAWSRSTGAGAKVMFIGSGVNEHSDDPTIALGNCGGLFGACASSFADGTMMMGSMLARENGVGVVGVAKGLADADFYSWNVFSSGDTIDLNSVYSGLNDGVDPLSRRGGVLGVHAA
jgi:hypothetical protein